MGVTVNLYSGSELEGRDQIESVRASQFASSCADGSGKGGLA